MNETKADNENSVLLRVAAFARDEDGQDLIEYAMVSTLVVLLTVGMVELLGNNLNDWYSTVGSFVRGLSGTLGA